MKYIDLGLPSNTLWADEDVDGFYDFEYSQTLGQVPTIEQWFELEKYCKFHLQKNALVVMSKINNNVIKFKHRSHRNGSNFLDHITCSAGLFHDSKTYKSIYLYNMHLTQAEYLVTFNIMVRLIK